MGRLMYRGEDVQLSNGYLFRICMAWITKIWLIFFHCSWGEIQLWKKNPYAENRPRVLLLHCNIIHTYACIATLAVMCFVSSSCNLLRAVLVQQLQHELRKVCFLNFVLNSSIQNGKLWQKCNGFPKNSYGRKLPPKKSDNVCMYLHLL